MLKKLKYLVILIVATLSLQGCTWSGVETVNEGLELYGDFIEEYNQDFTIELGDKFKVDVPEELTLVYNGIYEKDGIELHTNTYSHENGFAITINSNVTYEDTKGPVIEFKEEIVLDYAKGFSIDDVLISVTDHSEIKGTEIVGYYDTMKAGQYDLVLLSTDIFDNSTEVKFTLKVMEEVVDEVVDEVIVKGSKKVEPIVNKQTTAPKSNNNQTTPPKANNDTNNSVQAPEQPKVCTLNSSGSNAAQLVNEINYSRCLEGIAPLYYSNALQGYAQTRASEITTSFSHTRPNGQSWFSLNPSIINGENLYSGYDSATRAHTAFQNSPSHRKNNMNSRFKSVSVSIEYKDGIAYWAVLFSVY